MFLACSSISSCLVDVWEEEFNEGVDDDEIGDAGDWSVVLFLVVVSPFLLFADGGDKALWNRKNAYYSMTSRIKEHLFLA